jgi:hypothetical protein
MMIRVGPSGSAFRSGSQTIPSGFAQEARSLALEASSGRYSGPVCIRETNESELIGKHTDFHGAVRCMRGAANEQRGKYAECLVHSWIHCFPGRSEVGQSAYGEAAATDGRQIPGSSPGT